MSTPGSKDAAIRDSATEQYESLRHQLLIGRYPPGSLLQETILGRESGVSRTPVREALARLEQDGLLVRAPRGYRVRHRTADEVLDIFEARIILEAHAASIAAIRHTELDLARLRGVLAQARGAADVEALWNSDTAFHQTLRQAAHNEVIAEVLHRLDAQMTIHGSYVARRTEGADLSRQEHEAIVTAVAARDAAEAGKRMTEHLTRVRDLRVAALVEEQEAR